MNAPFELEQDDQGRLTLKRPGEEDAADVRIRRSFPWSSADRFVSIRNAEGRELLLIDDLSTLPAAAQGMIRNWLDRFSFVPRITQVDEVDASMGYQEWKVQTDRGPVKFRVEEREDIRFLPDGRFRVKDADGNVYEMLPLDQLSDHSRKAIESLI